MAQFRVPVSVLSDPVTASRYHTVEVNSLSALKVLILSPSFLHKNWLITISCF